MVCERSYEKKLDGSQISCWMSRMVPLPLRCKDDPKEKPGSVLHVMEMFDFS